MAEEQVELIHTGDADKAWDPSDDKTWLRDDKGQILLNEEGHPVMGDPKHKVVWCMWDSREFPIRPGAGIKMGIGLAEKLIRRATEVKYEPKRDRSGIIFMEKIDVPPPLGIRKKPRRAGIPGIGEPFVLGEPEPESILITPKVKREMTAVRPEPAPSDMTRAELLLKAKELELNVDERLGTKRIVKLVEEAIKMKEGAK